MKKAYVISLLILFFSSCSHPEESTKKSETQKKDPAQTVVTENNSEAFKSFVLRLDEIGLPTTIAVDHGDLTLNPPITEEQMKFFAPSELDEKDGSVYAFGKMTKGDVTGILYYYSYIPNDPEDPEEISGEIYLAIYDATGKVTDYILLAIQHYGSGYTYMKSWEEIIYLFESEMEFIHLIKTTYGLQNHQFKKLNEEEKTFSSGEEGYKEFLNYMEKLME